MGRVSHWADRWPVDRKDWIVASRFQNWIIACWSLPEPKGDLIGYAAISQTPVDPTSKVRELVIVLDINCNRAGVLSAAAGGDVFRPPVMSGSDIRWWAAEHWRVCKKKTPYPEGGGQFDFSRSLVRDGHPSKECLCVLEPKKYSRQKRTPVVKRWNLRPSTTPSPSPPTQETTKPVSDS